MGLEVVVMRIFRNMEDDIDTGCLNRVGRCSWKLGKWYSRISGKYVSYKG